MNRLAKETSPYLLGHADQPVDWYPWGPDAWHKAREEAKPIFLSIGYSACHWCHVMARESFENEETARLLNENFVSIKVDREERPEVDEIYLDAVRMLTGSAGWPLSVFLTPDLKPFYGATYLPPEPTHGLPSFRRVLDSVLHHFKQERQDIEQAGKVVVEELNRISEHAAHEGALGPEPLSQYYGKRLQDFDRNHGGFGTAPKFPNPSDLQLLLLLARQPGFPEALSMVELTLRRMACGGIYDQLGGGFHRYSTDRVWLVPHFEKMLCDNALLADVYLLAYRVTSNEFYRTVAEETLAYLEREMLSPAGGFCSSQDADSSKGEGEFYLWTESEAKQAVGPELARLAADAYCVSLQGCYHGRNVLHLASGLDAILTKHRLQAEQFWPKLSEIRRRLKAARDRRERPRTDTKVLADWNGLVLSAFAKAYITLGQPHYLNTARSLADHIREELLDDGRLLHTRRLGLPDIEGSLTDYAFVVQGLLDFCHARFEGRCLKLAVDLTDRMVKFFADPDGGFYSTAAGAPGLITRARAAYDGATPSGGSVAIASLLRLARLTCENRYERVAVQGIRRLYSTALSMPRTLPRFLAALDYLLHPGAELVLFLPGEAGSTQPFRDCLRRHHDPYRTEVLVEAHRADQPAAELTPLVRGRSALSGRPTAYLCRNETCLKPVQTVSELGQLLESESHALDSGSSGG